MTSKNFALSDLCEIVSSKRVFAADYKDEGVPFFRGKEVSQLARGESVRAELFISEAVYEDAVSRTGKISPGDVLLTAVGTLGNVYRVKEDDQEFYFKDGNVLWLRNFRTDVDSSFLKHWLSSPLGRKKVLNTAIGSTQAALTIAGLSQIQIQLPSLTKQRAIAEFLDTTDSLIRLNQDNSSNLEKIAQTFFKSWFVDFEPVHAKARSQQPEGMDAETAALFPDSFDDSDMGPIPAGWSATELGEVANICNSLRKPLSSREREAMSGGYPYFGATGVLDKIEKFKFEGVYLLVAEDGTVTTSSGTPYLQYVSGKFWVSNHAHVIQGQEDFTTEQLLLSLQRIQLEPYVTGAVQRKLSLGNLKTLPILTATPSLNRAFGELIRPLFDQMRLAKEQSETLIQLRDSLLPRLISGELEIPAELLGE